MIYPITEKKYRCVKCGHEVFQRTNHYGHTYSWGPYNRCPECQPSMARVTEWECVEKEPEVKTGSKWCGNCLYFPACEFHAAVTEDNEGCEIYAEG